MVLLKQFSRSWSQIQSVATFYIEIKHWNKTNNSYISWSIMYNANIFSYSIFGLYYKCNLPWSCPSPPWSFTRRKFPIRFWVKKQNKKPNNRNEERFIFWRANVFYIYKKIRLNCSVVEWNDDWIQEEKIFQFYTILVINLDMITSYNLSKMTC